jgi:methionyl aminopeptidase
VYDGYYGDVAVTFPVGRITEEKARLLKVTEQALREGIEAAVEGGRLFDISYSIQSCVEGAGYSVIREFVGHGIGRELHEEPQVPNYGKKGTGPRLKRGMVMAIEPMVSMGKSDIIIRENGWTAAVRDGSASAHFEHTIAITDRGTEVLSQV